MKYIFTTFILLTLSFLTAEESDLEAAQAAFKKHLSSNGSLSKLSTTKNSYQRDHSGGYQRDFDKKYLDNSHVVVQRSLDDYASEQIYQKR